MFNSIKPIHMKSQIFSLFLVLSLFFIASCMPQQSAPQIENGNSTSPNPTATSTNYPEPIYTTSGIFVQESGTQYESHFSLPINFTDSFLIRGQALSVFLRKLPNTTRFCLVGKYTYSPGNDKFLILAAKPKSYTDLVKKTSEFYLQVEPSNDQSNQNDCLTYNLTNSLFSTASSPTASFSLNQVCSNCNSTVTSEGFKLYFNSGEAVPTLNLSSLALTISGSTSTTTNSCVQSSVCVARGFSCCLDGQCVTDGAVRPGSLTETGFAEAQNEVASNPNKFVLYPQYYFVCANRPEGDGSSSNQDPVDPAYDANMRLMELTQLYQCLNKVDGEFSYCTIKFSSASQKITAGTSFSATADDVNFETLNNNFSTGDYANNIVKIFYAGQVLYEANKTPLVSTDGSFDSNTKNDDLSSSQSVKIIKPLPINALDDHLYLTYKVDGSCVKLGATLARCSKNYIHNYSDTLSPSYHNNTKTYYLPSYADTSPSANIIVKISGIIVPEDATTWSKAQSPNRISFSGSYPLYQNQTVEIIYYVNSSITTLLSSKIAAQTQVNSMCLCSSTGKCNLRPLFNSQNALVNYECTQSADTSIEVPVNQTAYVSNKNVPHRYYDVNGVNYDEDYSTALDQEGVAFGYKNNDMLKPTNLEAYTGYTGFNEIYGTFSKMNPTGAKPAKMVRVKKDKIYDIFANSGVFSTCLTCGSDYYSSMQKIFPMAMNAIGGGYAPDNFASKRSGNTSNYRGDDLLFGRACFVPATMIPWTHTNASDVQTQRRNRISGQHFLYANGYNRDWYGFDYGSLIGSFDGVTWFSIGNQRRIKATSNKLFLAVNASFGDLNLDSNFNLTISETTVYSPAMPDHDTETTGGECQKSHFCSNDNDCIRQLGYDYTCQNIGTLTTSWPVSDANATEVIGTTSKSLVSLLGGSNGQSKRCVYRGRGAPCLSNLATSTVTYNGSANTGHLSCSSNNYCQSLTTGSSNRFNDRITRFANNPLNQNTASAAPTVSDTVGLGARIIGRPYDYYGSKTIPAASMTSLSANNLTALCIPGKNVASSLTTYDLNSSVPTIRTDSSDKILGIGATMSGTLNAKYLNSCPATDNLGASVQQSLQNLGSSDTLRLYTTAQNLSTNLLDLSAITSQNVFSSTGGSQITAIGYQRNACLRAPGASCFSDMDCAPSEFIANKVRAANLSGILNQAEESYWEEELVCGNPDYKYLQTGVLNTSSFNIKNNVCCREYGKTFTVYTEDNSSSYHWCDLANASVKVAGVNTNINSTTRYSRVHTAYDKMTCNVNQVTSTTSFALSLKANTTTDRYKQLASQFKTLDTVNSRTCCTKNWVRNFATENGGGHKWAQGKLQTIEKANFISLNWVPNNNSASSNPIPYECDPNDYPDPTCEMRDFTQADTNLYLKFFGALELVGIPQVALMSEDQVSKQTNGVDGNTSGIEPVVGTVMQNGMLGSASTAVSEDFINGSSKKLYSGTNYNALQSQLKKVFSENEFNCCLPSGQQVPDYTTADQCCTGYLANSGSSSTLRCCLPDFTDLTVYLSRYVSSEGRGLPDSSYDPDTGYIKEPAVVELMANQKNLCCSGKMARGVAIRKLPIPISGGTWVNQEDAWTKRFVYLSNAVDNNTEFGPIGSLFDAGIRWNNHVYCIPDSLQVPAEKP